MGAGGGGRQVGVGWSSGGGRREGAGGGQVGVGGSRGEGGGRRVGVGGGQAGIGGSRGEGGGRLEGPLPSRGGWGQAVLLRLRHRPLVLDAGLVMHSPIWLD